MISFAVTSYKRAKWLKYLLKSLEFLNNEVDYELCVSTFDDFPYDQLLKGFAIKKYHIVPGGGLFDYNLPKGRNLAYTASSGDIVFFIDSDIMFVSPEPIIAMMEQTQEGTCCFPLFYRWFTKTYFWDDPTLEKGQWAIFSWGQCMMHRNDCERHKGRFLGPWDEDCGKRDIRLPLEDVELKDRMLENNMSIIREQQALYHVWHHALLRSYL